MTSSGSNFGSDALMLELFAAEADMHLPVLSEGLLALEKGRAGKTEIDSMMRAAHSIKGAARIVGNETAVRVAHIMEDCFNFAKEGRVSLTSDAVDSLLQGVDTLQRVCSFQSGPELSEESIQSVLDGIAQVRDGTARASPPPVSSPSTTSAPPAQARAQRGEIAATARPEATTVVLPALFDDSTAEPLRRELCDILERRPARIVVDFADVDRLTVSAMALLLSFARDAASTQAAPAIQAIRAAPPVRRMLRIVGLDGAFGLVGR